MAAADESNPLFIAMLFDVQQQCETLWSPADLQQLLEHQLQISLTDLLAGFDESVSLILA